MSNKAKINKDKILDYIAMNEDKSVDQMAKELNVSKSTIYKYLKEFNAKAPYHKGYYGNYTVLAYVDNDLRQILFHPYEI